MKKQLVLVFTTILFAVILASSASATTIITNGIYNVYVDDTGEDIGTYSVSTGDNNPQPNENVLYEGADAQTSYLTVRDSTNPQNIIDYTSKNFNPNPPGQQNLDDYNPVVTQMSPTMVNVTWNVDSGIRFNLTQIISLTGTTVDDSRVNVFTFIRNLDQVSGVYSIRYLWDVEISDNDGPEIATQSPDGPWLTNEQTWTAPTFNSWKATDNPTDPTLTLWGSVVSGQPSRLMFADYSDSSDAPFDYTTNPAQQIADPYDNYDSAILYYWDSMIIPSGGAMVRSAYLYVSSSTNPVIPNGTTTNNTTALAATSAGTIAMQPTGTPLWFLIWGLLVVMGGTLFPYRKKQ